MYDTVNTKEGEREKDIVKGGEREKKIKRERENTIYCSVFHFLSEFTVVFLVVNSFH